MCRRLLKVCRRLWKVCRRLWKLCRMHRKVCRSERKGGRIVGKVIIKKRWLQNYNKSLDEIYFSKLKKALGEFKMDNLKSDQNKDFYGLFHESYSPLKLHVDSGFNEKAP